MTIVITSSSRCNLRMGSLSSVGRTFADAILLEHRMGVEILRCYSRCDDVTGPAILVWAIAAIVMGKRIARDRRLSLGTAGLLFCWMAWPGLVDYHFEYYAMRWIGYLFGTGAAWTALSGVRHLIDRYRSADRLQPTPKRGSTLRPSWLLRSGPALSKPEGRTSRSQ